MRDPGAVVAVARLPLLVRLDAGEGGGVGLRVVLDRDLSGHAPHGEGAPAVAGLDQLQGIGAQERLIHSHGRAVGGQAVALRADALDVAEDIVPSAAVEADNVVLQGEEDLVHLEGRRQRLDQHGRLDGPDRQAQRLLRIDEHVVPQLRLAPALELGEVEVGARPLRQRSFGVVVQIEAEVEQGARHGLPVHLDVTLHQVPAAGADDQHRQLFAELVGLACRRIDVGELARPAVLQIDLTLDHIGEGGGGGVLEVGHEHLRAGVQRVDDHLAVDGTRDLHPAVLQIRRNGRHPPVAGADLGRLGREVRGGARVETGLAGHAVRQQCAAASVEAAMKLGDEGHRLRRQHVVLARHGRGVDNRTGSCGGGSVEGHGVFFTSRWGERFERPSSGIRAGSGKSSRNGRIRDGDRLSQTTASANATDTQLASAVVPAC